MLDIDIDIPVMALPDAVKLAVAFPREEVALAAREASLVQVSLLGTV